MATRTRGTLFVMICVALWGLIPVVAKLGQSGLDNHQFLFWSSLISASVMLLTCFFNGDIRQLSRLSFAEGIYLVVLGLLGTYVYYLFLYLGYARAVGLEVLAVQYSWPMMIVLLSLFLLGESLTLRKIIAVLLGFAGVMIVLTRGQLGQLEFNNPQVLLLVGAGSLSFALFSVLSKKVRVAAIPAIFVYFAAATVASFVSMLVFSGFAMPSQSDWVPVALNGILVNGYSYVFWILALKSAPASYLAPFTYLAPALSAVYLVIFFDNPFLVSYAIGLGLIITAGLVNSTARS